MYAVGSVADLISGSKSTNNTTLELQEVAPEPTPETQENGAPPAPRPKGKNAKKQQRNKNKNNPNLTGPFKLKRKSNDNENESVEPEAKRIKKDEVFVPDKNKRNAMRRLKIAKDPISDPDRDARTIFVGNVPINSNKKDLKKYFSTYGTVASLRFRGVPSADPKVPKKIALIQKKFHPSRKSLQCYVVYTNFEDAQKAVEANGEDFKGHHLRVDLCQTAEPDQKKAIFIGNLPFDAEDDDVWKLFQDCGYILSVRIVRDEVTRIGKGFGYVNFDNADAIELALQMEDVKLGTRVLRISRCSAGGGTKKRSADGKKIRKVPRVGVPKPKPIQTKDSLEKTAEFQGTQFSDKKKKKKTNKSELKMKKMSKILTANKT